MKLSKKGEYALKALLALTFSAKVGSRPVLHLTDISEGEDIPIKFLEHIMAALKRGRLVNSQKGKGGGYVLARSPKEILLGEVIRLIDGPLSPIGSVDEIKEIIRKGKKESGIYSVLLDVRNAISDILDKTTLEDLHQRTLDLIRVKNQYEMYYI